MSTSSPLLAPNGSLETPRPALPSFSPVRYQSDSHNTGNPESSASGSLRSQSGDRSQAATPVRQSISSSSNIRLSAEHQPGSYSARRTSNRNSGGFLLGSVGRNSRISRTFLQQTETDAKGKRRSEESELSIPKRRLRDVGHRPTSSIGSSPLSAEVKPDSGNGNGNVISGTDVRYPVDAPALSTIARRQGAGQGLENGRPNVPSVGYDTDPAQIVSMALTLSEARKRQASAKRYVSTDKSGRRNVSAAANSSPRNRAATGSIAQYLTPDRSASISSKDRPRTPQQGAPDDLAETEVSPRTEGEDHAVTDEDGEQEISQATEQRVQKARTYFELAYEHRRLLSHLPPVRRPGAQARSPSPNSQSKAYNPLQYIRNRKLRIWDKTTFNAEEDGWHDIEKVRNWVNAVVGSQPQAGHEPDECVRLPPLSKPNSHGEESESDAKKDKPNGDQPVKKRRPRSDWVTHPGDMIADCFWLEQGVNKIKILDRDNNHIYPRNTQFRFSGWRNRTPVDIPAGLHQRPTQPPEERDEEYSPQPQHSPAPELPIFRSAHQQQSQSGNKLRKREKFKDSFAVAEDGRDRRKGLKTFMEDSDSGSDSDHSPGASEDEGERGRKRLSKKWQKYMASDDSSVPGSLRSPPTKDSAYTNTLSPSDQSQPSSSQNSKRPSVDQGILARLTGHTPGRSQTRAEKSHHESLHKFPSYIEQPRNSAEYDDTTAPSSPVVPKWPSIAINLESPPPSRSPSPAKKLKHTVLNPFRDRSHSNRPEGVSTADFALKQSHQHVSREHEKDSGGSRGTSPMTRGQSPLSHTRSQSNATDASIVAADHRVSTVSRVNSKSGAPAAGADHSKIRGMFKGGRIAELVGHEVSKVGDFIWKREPPGTHRRHGSASDASLRSGDDSDNEEHYPNGLLYKTPPKQDVRSRSSTLSSTSDKSPTLTKSSPGSGERPKYNNPNLPSFTSPFQKDKDKQDQKQNFLTPSTSPDMGDHISRIAAEHRSASRSPRMNRLAPPKLDTSRPASPSRPDGLSHTVSYGFSGLDLGGSRAASAKYNDALKKNPSLNSLRVTNSARDLSRMSSRDMLANNEPHPVTTADIERASVLLLSSAIKAREIGRRADAPRPTPKFLLDSVNENTARQGQHVDLSLVSRREEHVVAARNIMATLGEHGSMFDEMMKSFSGEVVPGLHKSLQELEDLVENKMTPRVQVSADEAGELSMKLATRSRLAVKELHDTIDRALRRRRHGPIRWVRRLWFAGIEYAVVSLLWGIWAVVSIIRIVIAVFGGTAYAVRWMLWLE